MTEEYTISGSETQGGQMIEQFQDERFERERTRSRSGNRGINSFGELLNVDGDNILNDLLGTVAQAASTCQECRTREEYNVYLASYFLKSLDKSGADYSITKKSKSKPLPLTQEDHPLKTQALNYHSDPMPGKYTIVPTKPMDT